MRRIALEEDKTVEIRNSGEKMVEDYDFEKETKRIF